MPEAGGSTEARSAALRAQQAAETLRAIGDGEVDALVMRGGTPEQQVFTLSSADRPYRLFVDTMADGAATVSDRGVVLYANQRLADLARVPVARLVGAQLARLVTARHRLPLLAYNGSSVSPDGLEVELLSEGRSPVWCRVGASTLDVDGERMVCLTFADLTVSRRHQTALASAHEKALRALRTRSQFVANMSHEIRTPLNGVIGMAGLMLTTDLSDEQREYADGIRTSGDALMAVVDQILDFSKLDSGSLEIEDIPFSPLAVLEDTCSIVAPTAQGNGLELLSQVDGLLPTLVSGDNTRLRQVLTNLLGNAVKFTATGHVCATVSAVSEGHGWRLRFSVHDTGVGIELQDTGRIFNSFSQADGSTTRRFGGTGLGLAISRQLVGLMGGTIGVESEKGIGSTFWFTVFTGVVPEVGRSLTERPLPRSRVLVVDDNAASRDVLQSQLVGWGLSCTAVPTAEQALTLFHERHLLGQGFDVLLLDSDMPGMSGIELAKALRSIGDEQTATGGEPETPIVLLITDQRDRAAGRLVGVDFFVSKPVRQGRLYDALADALNAGIGKRDQADTEGDGSGHRGKLEAASAGKASSAVPAEEPGWVRPVILLVEDNPTNQLVAVRMLQQRGYEVDVASDGRGALDRYASRAYSAILMDCQMPVLDGYQATAEIRRRESADLHVPILAMTANTMKGDRDKCLSSGMDDYLGKPFTGEALDLALTGLLNSGRPRPQGATLVTVPLEAKDATEAIFDVSVVEDLCGHDDELRHDLLVMFERHLRAALGTIQAAVASPDLDTLLAEAHTLKGSAGSVGALRVAQISDSLCRVVRGGELIEVDDLVNDLRSATAATLALLSIEVPAASAPGHPAGV